MIKLISLHTAYGRFHFAIAELSYCDNTTCLRMYKIFSILLIIEKKKFAISRSKYTMICLFYGFLMFISYFTVNNLSAVVYIFHKKYA